MTAMEDKLGINPFFHFAPLDGKALCFARFSGA